MGSLFKWEMKQTFSSKSFWILGAALVALPSLLLLLTLFFADEYSGYNAFLEGLNNYNAFVIFLIGVFAGIHVTGAFEGRKIQSAVMAGNSRFNILMAKFLSFITSVGIYSAVAITISSVIAFSMQGINGFDDGFARAVIVRSLVFIAVEIAYSATCFFASMFVRHLGGAIGLNLGLMLISDIAVQILFSFDWMIKYLNYIPAAQTMLVMGDISNENIARALISSVVACALVVALSYLKFRREELK